MREHCNGYRLSHCTKTRNVRWQGHAESVAKVKAGWEAKAIEVPLTLDRQNWC